MKKIIAILLAGLMLFTVGCTNDDKANSISALERETKLKQAYLEQNEFIFSTGWDKYFPLEENTSKKSYLLARIFYYDWKTDSDLTFEEVKDYASSEFESDGSVRIYNNGNWPQIQNYVEWWNEEDREEEFEEFKTQIGRVQSEYDEEYPQLRRVFFKLTFHNLNEVMMKVKDERYEPNFEEGTRYTDGTLKEE